jgi:hypothetical protein
VISTLIMGSPVRRLLNPITRCRDQPRNRYAGTDDGPGTGQKLDADRLTLMSGYLRAHGKKGSELAWVRTPSSRIAV